MKYSDASSFTFVTLERPNLHFDPSGQLTHINFAADLTTTDAGCQPKDDLGKARSCAECKFYNHCDYSGVGRLKLEREREREREKEAQILSWRWTREARARAAVWLKCNI